MLHGRGASIDDLQSSYDPGEWLATSLTMLKRRYPAGHCLINPRQDDPYLPEFAEPGTFTTLAQSLDTMVHEMTHLYQGEISEEGYLYYVNCDIVIKTQWHDAFPRSEIAPLVEGSSTDLYKDYLGGELGAEGLNFLLDEWNAYTNGFGASALFADCYEGTDGSGYATSAMDGPLAFAYFTELYLRVARTDHPDEYAFITGDESFRTLMLTTWDRMHFFLQMAEGNEWLKVYADDIKELVYADDNLKELEDALGMTLAKSSCQ